MSSFARKATGRNSEENKKEVVSGRNEPRLTFGQPRAVASVGDPTKGGSGEAHKTRPASGMVRPVQGSSVSVVWQIPVTSLSEISGDCIGAPSRRYHGGHCRAERPAVVFPPSWRARMPFSSGGSSTLLNSATARTHSCQRYSAPCACCPRMCAHHTRALAPSSPRQWY